MDRAEFRARTKAFAIDAIRLVESLPTTRTSEVVGRQLLRSATSVAANYRASGRARSRQEMIAKLGIVEEEADESIFWFEVLEEISLGDAAALARLRIEANQILAMVVASRKTLRSGGAAGSTRRSNIEDRRPLRGATSGD